MSKFFSIFSPCLLLDRDDFFPLPFNEHGEKPKRFFKLFLQKRNLSHSGKNFCGLPFHGGQKKNIEQQFFIDVAVGFCSTSLKYIPPTISSFVVQK